LSASLVFEQEYHGVEGDSASCAELYCLLSALSSQPILQGLAVTGAMNQHGEVMAIGGVNEKIEGYFRICKRLGLDGKQGVLIPSRNISHLLLDDDVIEAVEQGQFHIYAADTVQDGIALLTGVAAGEVDAQGKYAASSLLAMVEQKLKQLRDAYAVNRVTRLS
ncbi:MAG: S16 family serine protease, partial [Pseudomonadota bacterium]